MFFWAQQEKPLFLLDEMVSEISAADASQSRWPLWYLCLKKGHLGCLGLYAIGYRGLPRYVGIKKTTHHLKLTQQNQDFHIFKG